MIKAEHLSREFNGTLAVNEISFSVEEGEIFGFLGHNGAGKTTTVRMLTGQLKPTRGKATVAGYDVISERNQIKPLIGVVFEHQNLYERMSGRENLMVFAKLHGMGAEVVDELLEMVQLSERADERIKVYSNGMKQRLIIARALLNQPSVLFMDEPTRGLDPTAARGIRSTIQTLGEQGTTVFLTTHYMEEADQLCRRVAFISEGSIIALDTPQNLKLQFGTRKAAVLLKNQDEHLISLDDPEDAKSLETWMRDQRVLTMHSQEATLEDVFVNLAGRSLQ